MKRIISLVLSLSILMSLFGGLDISVFATTETPSISETELIDLDIYKAQCLAGIAYDPNSNAVELCNSMYNYYINDNIHSPTQTFLEECYNDDALMADYTEWMAYSLAASPSSALDYVMKKEDYYEALIIAMYSKALTEDSEWEKIINNKIVNDTTNILSGLCDVLKLEQASQLDEILDLSDPKTFEYVSDTVEKYYPVGTAGKVVGIIGTALKYGQNITDACQRISTYNAMVELDNSAKLWLNQMYESCDGNTDPSLKAALLDLKSASTGFAEAALVDIKEASFSLANWSIQAVMDYGVAQLAALNPITASVVVGLQAGKTICNVFFATDDVCEQLFLMECIYDVQHLSRIVADDCKATFIDNQTKNNALSFTFSVECYYESIIDVDIDCMIKFLDKLYNGGILKGFLKWVYGATDDYDQCVAALEALRTARIDNYIAMNDYYRQALQINYPDTYKYYFVIEQIVPITGIGFQKYIILPPGYPAGYANIIVDSFSYVDVYFEPSNTTQKAYTLTSDNPNVLEINDGVMTAISEGTANVTVTSLDNPAVSYTSEIKVGAKLVDVDIDTSTTRFKYKIENNEITITGLVSGYKPETLQIPEAISEYPVTKIADFAFLNNKSIKNITIPSTVTEIGNYAFYKCSALTQINFSEGLETIGDGAFGNCSVLKAAILPYTVSNLGISAFENCSSLLNVQLSSGITELKDRTFYNCDSLEEITVSKYVTKFGQGIFGGCDSLKKVFFGINKSPATNKQIYHTSSTLQNIKNITISDDVQIIDTMCFYGTELYSVTIPDSIKTIGGYVGDYSDLNHIFYEGTESSWSSLISKASQYGSTQTLSKIKNAGHIHFEVSLQNNTSIKDEIAPTCTADGSNNIYCNICNELLGSEVIPATGHVGKLVQKVLPTCTEQGYSKYYCIVCDEEYITDYVSTHQHNYDENGSCYTCDKNIFFKYSISNGEVTITDCLTDKSKLTIPNHIEFLPVKYIADKAFKDCTSLLEIDISGSVISIGKEAFSNCSNLEKITVGSTVTSIGDSSFYGCTNLESIVIPDGVKNIGDSTFYGCTNLESIVIPNSVTNIGTEAFNHCSNLQSVTLPCSVESSWLAFSCCYNVNKVVLTKGTGIMRDNYYSGYSWPWCDSEQFDVYVESGVTNIGGMTFVQGKSLCNIYLSDTVKTIGYQAFSGCSNLSEIDLCNVQSIESNAFYGCAKLESIKIPDTIKEIDSGVFNDTLYYNDESNWEDGVLYIDNCLIEVKDFVNNKYVPKSELKCIAKGALPAYREWSILIGDFECDPVSESAFAILKYNGNTSKLIIPNQLFGYDVINIKEYAFQNCASLESVTIPDGITEIAAHAFENCLSLTEILVSTENAVFSSENGVLFDKDKTSLLRYPCAKTDKNYVIPNSVTTVDNGAFFDNDKLECLTISKNVKSIAPDYSSMWFSADEEYPGAFYNNTSLKKIIWNAERCYLVSEDEYYDPESPNYNPVYSLCILASFFPACTEFIIGEEVKYIPCLILANNQNIKSINISDNVTGLGVGAFYNCTNLTSVTIPDSLTEITSSSFYGCHNLKDVYFAGTSDDWTNITFDGDSGLLDDVYIHYNTSLPHYDLGTVTKEATCTTDGEVTYICPCGYIKTEIISAFGHDEEVIKTVNPTCTENGYTEYRCNTCGETYNADWVYSTGHTKGDVIESVNPSCTQDGYTRYNCSVCGITFTTDWVWAQGHTKDEIVSVVDPTCEESGYTIYSCSICSLTFKSDWIYSNGHTQGSVIEVVEATCTEDGYTKYKCSSCDEEFIDNWTYATGHSGEAIKSVDATCIEKGYTEFLCDSCRATYNSDFTSPIGHVFENDICVNCSKDKEDCIESSHNYENNCDETWIINKPNADYITITFSSSTETERGWDYIYIYDMDDNLIGQFTGTELASQTITVTGNMVKIRLTSDSSVNKYGFAVSNIVSYVKVSSNDIDILMPENTIDPEVELIVEEIDVDNIVIKLPDEFDAETANVYDIYFEKDEQRVQPNGAVTVYIPVPSDMDGEKCKVFHIDESGNVTDMNAVYEDGYMVFTTDHFSYYALVEEKAGFIYGDANGDTVIDGRDVVRLKNYLANYDYDTGTSTVEIFDGADANGDGTIDGRDVIRLKNYLANYDYDTDSSTVVLGPQN